MKRIWTRVTVVLLLTGSLVLWRILAQANSTPTSPLAWQQQDVGATGLKGAGAQADAGWVVQGAGADIWGGADAFHMVYVPWDGDAELIARVVSVEKTDPWAKAGLMIRASLTETSPHAFVAWTPQKGATFIRRSAAGARSRDDSHQAMRMVMGNGKVIFQQRGSAGADQAVDAITPQASPRWLRLVRQGNSFRAFDSADGLNWEWLGTEALDLPSKTFVGLAVSSHDSAHLCTVAFEQVSLNTPKVSSVAAAKVGTGDGLQATYYPSMDLSGKGIARIDPTVNFDWGWGAPDEGIGRNQFSVRWEGELEAQFTEPYAIHMTSDDRAQVWINGELLIDEWYEHGEQTSTALANLEAGKRYLLRVEYFENRGRAMAKLLWSSPSTPQQAIPQSQLYSRLTNQSGDGVPDLWKVAHGLDPADASAADHLVNGTGLTARQLYESGFEPAAPGKPIGAWLSQDLGRVGLEGSAALSGDTWTVQSSGADIWANADAFQFIYQPWRGDGQIVARVLSQENTDPWAKAGLMIRTSLRADAPHVMLAATPEHGLALLRREAPAQSTEAQPADSSTAQPWLKLVRLGAAVSAFTSSDGEKWSWIDTESLDADGAVYIGLAVCSHDNSKLGTASFNQVTLSAPPPKTETETETQLAAPGSGDGLRANYFDATTGRIVSRIDVNVNFDWDIDSPAEGIGPNFFSARWEGFLEARSTDLYRLHVWSDDGARLWLDDQLLIDGWSDHGGLEQSAIVSLEAGRRYALKLEYFQRAGEASCKLLWSTPTIPKQPVPQSQLSSAPESGPAAPPTDTGSATVPSVSEGTEANAGGGSPTSNPTTTLPSAGLTPALTGTRLVQAVAGSDPVARLGRWEVDDTFLYAVDRRGWVEYELNAPSANLYRVEVEAASHNPFDLDPGFYLIAWVDGEYLGRVLLDAMPGQTGTVQVLAPWLKPGPHRFRFFWDNVRKGRSLQIKAVRLQSLLGPDTNGNGVIDWVEDRLARENGIGLAPLVPTNQPADSAPSEISSAISPACLEGRGAFLGLMKIHLADGSEIRPRPGAGDHWYANVPLASDTPTEVEVSFQNGGRVDRCRITWKRSNLLQAQELAVRQGDSLLLTASPESAPPAELMQATSEIALGATVQYAGPATGAWAQRFDQAGVFTVTGTYALDSSQTRTVNVKVLSGALTGQPAAWTGKSRLLDISGLPPESVLEADPRVQVAVEALPDSGKRLRVMLDQPEDRSLVARLGAAGPILASATIRGLNIYGVSESGAFYGQKYEDGSCLVETAVAQTRVFPDVTVELRIVVAGVMFSDGSLTKTLRAVDFDEAGLANLSFIMPPGVQTSNCHIMRAYQNEAFLGEY